MHQEVLSTSVFPLLPLLPLLPLPVPLCPCTLLCSPAILDFADRSIAAAASALHPVFSLAPGSVENSVESPQCNFEQCIAKQQRRVSFSVRCREQRGEVGASRIAAAGTLLARHSSQHFANIAHCTLCTILHTVNNVRTPPFYPQMLHIFCRLVHSTLAAVH